MKISIQLSMLSLIMLILFSCSEDVFFLRNEGADMPLLIKGNTKSDVFILYLHGGPGASGFYDEFGDFFSIIESQYAMVYWEQRAAGISQGNAKPESLTPGQFFEDIDKVILLVRELYNHPKIVLMGHSWGGGLGTAYLVKKSEQNFNDLIAWIEIDGTHNPLLGKELSRQRVLDFANEQIVLGNKTEYWKEAIEWYSLVPVEEIGSDLYSKHYEYVYESGGNWYGQEHNYASMRNILFSPSTGFDFLSNNSYTHQNDGMLDITDFTNQINKISLPSLILWGKHDGIIPVDLAQDAYENIGTPDQDKYVEIFDKSAHSPYIEEKEKFNSRVIEFIEIYD